MVHQTIWAAAEGRFWPGAARMMGNLRLPLVRVLPRGKAARAHEPCCMLSKLSPSHYYSLFSRDHESITGSGGMPMRPGGGGGSVGPSRSQDWMQPAGLLPDSCQARCHDYKISLSTTGHHQGPPISSAEARGCRPTTSISRGHQRVRFCCPDFGSSCIRGPLESGLLQRLRGVPARSLLPRSTLPRPAE